MASMSYRPEPLTAIPNPAAAQAIVDAAKDIEGAHDIRHSEVILPSKNLNFDDFDAGQDRNSIIEEFDGSNLPKPERLDNGNSLAAIGEEGFEAIAFYKSFRFVDQAPARGKWGIFFVKDLMLDLVTRISDDTSVSTDSAFEALVRKVYTHELFHYHTDATCLQREIFSTNAIYRPYRVAVSKLPIDKWFEESLANYYGLLRLKKCWHLEPQLFDYIRRLVLFSPGAYALGGLSDCRGPRQSLVTQLCSVINTSAMSTGVQSILQQNINTDTQFGLRGRLAPMLKVEFVPVYWISATWLSRLSPAYQAVTLKEIETGFLKRYLKAESIERTDHPYYRIDNGERVKVPNPHDKVIRPHEFDNIRKKAGLSNIEFAEERKITKQWSKNVPRNEVKPPIR